MVTKPVVILPFIIIAFLEGLALEFIYFSTRPPIYPIINPIVKKFFGETFVHYPNHLLVLPNLFYNAQIAIYLFIGVFLTAISINIFKNIKEGLPLKANALIKNASKRYLSFFGYAIIVIALIILLKNADKFVYLKFTRLCLKRFPQLTPRLYQFGFVLFLFLTNVIMQVFLILAIPFIVIKKKGLFRAIASGVILSLRNFITLFILIFLPFLIYLPLTLAKSFSLELVNKTFPEINVYVTIIGIPIAAFIDCFIILCASQFLIDMEEKRADTALRS